MPTQPFDEREEDWLKVDDDGGDDSLDASFDASFDDEETLEFVITSADEEDETTWEWDGTDWRRVA